MYLLSLTLQCITGQIVQHWTVVQCAISCDNYWYTCDNYCHRAFSPVIFTGYILRKIDSARTRWQPVLFRMTVYSIPGQIMGRPYGLTSLLAYAIGLDILLRKAQGISRSHKAGYVHDCIWKSGIMACLDLHLCVSIFPSLL